MQVKIPYDKKILSLDIPVDEKQVTRLSEPPSNINIIKLFNNKLDSSPFPDEIKGLKKIGIILPDYTRKGPVSLLLEFLVAFLKKISKTYPEYSIFFASGLHRPMRDSEIKEIIKNLSVSPANIIVNNADDENQHTSIAKTDFETDVSVLSEILNVDALISISNVLFHYYSGFSGGGKSYMPGVSTRSSINNNHKLTLDRIKGRNPKCYPGIIEGNPVFEDIIKFTELIPKPKFGIQFITNINGDVVELFIDELFTAHKKAIEFRKNNFTFEFEEPFDCAICGSGGWPTDCNYIQAHKTMEISGEAVKPGGIIIHIGACKEGWGSPHFLPIFKEGNSEKMEIALRKNYQVSRQTAWFTRTKTETRKVFMYSDLPENEIKMIGAIPINLDDIHNLISKTMKIILLPCGISSIPVLTCTGS